MKARSLFLLLAVVGCGDASVPTDRSPDAAGIDMGSTQDTAAAPDASPDVAQADVDDSGQFEDLGPAQPLEIGACRLADRPEDCTGTFEEDASFSVFGADATVPLVTGPQGSVMLVFMLRTKGVHGGDPDDFASADNPEIRLTLLDDTTEVSNLRVRVGLKESGEWQVTPAGLFVVVHGLEASLVDKLLTVEARLDDKDGRRREGRAFFTAVAN